MLCVGVYLLHLDSDSSLLQGFRQKIEVWVLALCQFTLCQRIYSTIVVYQTFENSLIRGWEEVEVGRQIDLT